MAYVVLLASMGMSGNLSDASTIRDEFEQKFPDYEIKTFIKASRWANTRERAAIFREGLRKAGIPE